MAVATIYNGVFLLVGVNNDKLQLSDDYQDPCCCGGPCENYYAEGFFELWGSGGLTTTSQDLNEICLMVAGQTNRCGNNTIVFWPLTALADWVDKGGLLFVKTEYPGCGDLSAMESYLSAIGVNITFGNKIICCPGGPNGYDASVASLPVTAGLSSTVHSGGASAEIFGGIPILTCPACPTNPSGSPGGVVLVGQMVGRGAVFVSADSNLDISEINKITVNAVNIRKSGGSYF